MKRPEAYNLEEYDLNNVQFSTEEQHFPTHAGEESKKRGELEWKDGEARKIRI